MPKMPTNPLELARLHIDALYTYNTHGCITGINQWDGGTPPKFVLTRTVAGNLWRTHADLPDGLTEQLDVLCRQEPPWVPGAQEPIHRDSYARLLSALAPVEKIGSGPAYGFSQPVKPSRNPVAIHTKNADLLRGGLDDWVPDVPYRRPFLAMVEEDRAVALCASVRITDAAHEAGVETLSSHRRQGHGANVVAGWAAAVKALGATPLYSTSWDNVASQGLAARLGLSMFAVDFHIS